LRGFRRNRRLSKDYELKVQTSEAFIDLAAIRLMLKRLDYASLARLQRLEQASPWPRSPNFVTILAISGPAAGIETSDKARPLSPGFWCNFL
jgi:hypothetical protein